MKKGLKNFYGAHPLRRTLITLGVLLLAAAGLYFRPAFSLRAAALPETAPGSAGQAESGDAGAAGETGTEITERGKLTVAQKDGRILELDTAELVFTLTDEESGKTWTTALPGGREGVDKALLQLTFLGKDNLLTQWNTYDNCVAFGSYRVFRIPDGVRLELDVNEGESSEFFEYLPQRIPTERYEQFLLPGLQAKLEEGALEEVDYKKYERALRMVYKKNNAENCYVLTTSGTPSISAANQLIALTKLVGYDRQMLIEDCAAYGVTPDFHEPAQFDLVLEAVLDGGDLVLSMPGDRIRTGNDYYQLWRVAVLPSLGAEPFREDGDGFFLLPDGAGALMRFNTYAATVPEYVRPFLDNDYYSDYYYMPEYGQELMTPVFGILNGGDDPQQGLLAILEGGVETANLHCTLASPSGSGVNRVYASFDVMDYSRVKIYGAYADNGATYVSSSGPIPADYRLRYRPYGRGVTYFDLAMDYRQYLSERTGREITLPQGPGAYLEFVGGVTLADRILGIPYDRSVTMTSYDDLTEILRGLPAEGLALQYDGSWNGGVLSGLNDGAVNVPANGDTAARARLEKAAADAGVPLFWQANLSRVYANGRSYVPYFHALRDFSNQAAEIYSYSPATAIFNGHWDPVRAYTRVSPRYLPYLAEKLKAGASAGSAFAVGDLAHDFFLDYRYRDIINPVQARALARQALETLAGGSSGSLSLHDPAADLAPLGDWAVDVSRRSSDYASFYATVPFRQLALSGLTRLAGEDVNLSSRGLEDHLLEAAELGTSVKYTLTAENPYRLKNSHFEYLYAVSWADWRQEVLEAAARTADLRKRIGGRAIENHRMLTPEVFETTYSGGLRVTVNYGSDAYETETLTVPARSYLLESEGGTISESEGGESR